MVGRLLAAYRQAAPGQYGDRSMWRDFFNAHHKGHHDVFLRGDVEAARQILAHPAGSNLFYGFDELCADFVAKYHSNLLTVANGCKDNLLRLAEAVGVARVECSEHGPWLANARTPTDEVMAAIEAALGCRLSFPDIYAGMAGDRSGRGLVTYRAVHALYLAYRARQLLGARQAGSAGSVCEIGAGLGRSALHARQLGLENYTIVDLPMTTISQGYYLMRCLGEEAVVLPGERRRRADQVRLMNPDEFFALEESFDLVANVDSLTEVGDDLAARYLRKISVITPQFLSINHECNTVRLRDLAANIEPPHSISRHPYWMRHGYVEELIAFGQAP
jgi:hypothetical protein